MLISKFFNPEFLSTLNEWHFKRIREKVNNDKEFFEELDNLIMQIPYNSFHYNLLGFYQNVRKDFDFQVLTNRISQLKL